MILFVTVPYQLNSHFLIPKKNNPSFNEWNILLPSTKKKKKGNVIHIIQGSVEGNVLLNNFLKSLSTGYSVRFNLIYLFFDKELNFH